MRKRIILILKIWAPLYILVSRVYYFLQWYHLAELFFHTKAREFQWQKRHISEGYWNNRGHPSRILLLEKTVVHRPKSILEVGCASGANLYLLNKKYPHARILGIDINRKAVEYGNSMFTLEGVRNVSLIAGSIDRLKDISEKSYDIVFTDALLIYVGQDKIKQVIQRMLYVASKALILMECHTPSDSKSTQDFYCGGIWLRDYKTLLRQYVSEEQLQITKIPEAVFPASPWKEHGYIIEVKKVNSPTTIVK